MQVVSLLKPARHRLHFVLQVCFIAGVMYTTVGLLRLGWLTNFLSHTTISGFMSGACFIIAMSQVRACLLFARCL